MENRRYGTRLAEPEELGGAGEGQLHAAIRRGDGGGVGESSPFQSAAGVAHSKT
ncbi:MAG: hypothetical protein KIS67_05530 [Verrucomicrobiae bacterium]|nr:hypothetical protein [Verrucomicrobiae bacterium]